MTSRANIITIIFLTIIAIIHCHAKFLAVEQCPGSEVVRIRQQTQYHEVSLIFYYTNWSADSLSALAEYNDVAQHYSDKIYFSSIDCWHLSCNCSKALTTTLGSGWPHKWPTLMAYYGSRGQLQMQYHGLWTFRDIQEFVDHLLNPLERLQDEEDLQKIRQISDAVIVGVFDSPDSVEYKQYLIASLKWLESDPLRTYRFAVTFSANVTFSGDLLKGHQSPDVIFLGPTSVRTFKQSRDHIWNATYLLMWLHKELKRDFNYLHGYATPISIAQKLKQQPVLAIFVNDPPRFFAYMEQYADEKKAFTALSAKCFRIQKTKSAKNLFKDLKILNVLEQLQIYTDHKMCYYNINALFRNLAYYFEIEHHIKNMILNISYTFKSTKLKAKAQVADLLKFYHHTECLKADITTSASLQIGVIKNLQKIVESDMKLTSNRSVSVVLLETERYKDYLENLGVKAQPQIMANSLIIDKKQESIFLMPGDFDIANLKGFITQHRTRNLMPHFRKEDINTLLHSRSSNADSFIVKDINRDIFVDRLYYAHNQTLIVLLHSPECALCGSIQQTFIQLASALRQLTPELNFVRINAFLNNMPWQFNMPTLPAIIVFPKNNYGNSRLFPSHLKPDFRSIFSFILNQLSPHDQMKIAVTYCQSSALSSEHSQPCWQFAKTLLMQHIGKHLHYWQLFETERKLIFERLRVFKDLSLDIQRNLRL